ncbi:NYN domain-containing protein [Candidatus Harpocratesius sp.]
MQFPKNVDKLVVDGANIAFFSKTKKNKARIVNLKILIDWLNQITAEYPNLQTEIIIDNSLQYKIDDPKQLEKMLKKGILKQTPAKIKADSFIIELMSRFDGSIVVISNDLFRDYPMISKISKRLQYGFMILFNQFFPMHFEFSIRYLENSVKSNSNSKALIEYS